MKLQMSDWKWASIAAIALTALATAVVFGIRPGGFEGQMAWYFMLLPASIVAEPISDVFNKASTREESVVFWVLLVCFNFLWYFGISYTIIKAYRFFSGASKTS